MTGSILDYSDYGKKILQACRNREKIAAWVRCFNWLKHFKNAGIPFQTSGFDQGGNPFPEGRDSVDG
ncbi:MAG: hypothetical protein ACE5L7_06765 [Candidatus Aminicenantales bacterium]